MAKGFTQIEGIDFQETFSPVTRYKAIRFLLAHAALEDWEFEAMDIKMAFLYGKVVELVVVVVAPVEALLVAEVVSLHIDHHHHHPIHVHGGRLVPAVEAED